MEFASIKPDYTWLDCTKPAFGARGGMTWLQQEHFHPDRVKALLFELRDKRLPGGKAIGKCMPLTKNDDYLKHPLMHEQRFLKYFDQQFTMATLPQILAFFPFVGVFSDALTKLPLEIISDHIHGYCGVFIAVEYWGNLWDFAQDENMAKHLSVTAWKQIIFQVVYTLNTLQKDIGFQHNDLHAMNILIDIPKDKSEIEKRYVLPKSKKSRKRKGTKQSHICFPDATFQVKLWDFETSICHTKSSAVPQPLKHNVNSGPAYCTPDYLCPFYDVHSFLMQVLEIETLPTAVQEWITSLYPPELIPNFQKIEEMRIAACAVHVHQGTTPEIDSGITDTDPSDIAAQVDFHNVAHMLLRHPRLTSPANIKLYNGLHSWWLDHTEAMLKQSQEECSTEVEDQSDDNGGIIEAENTSVEIPAEWFYEKGSTFEDYILCNMAAEEKQHCIDNREVGRNSFMEADENGLLAYNKLCIKAWDEKLYKLPKPIDIITDPFFKDLIEDKDNHQNVESTGSLSTTIESIRE